MPGFFGVELLGTFTVLVVFDALLVALLGCGLYADAAAEAVLMP
jgi:hypothetical protein